MTDDRRDIIRDLGQAARVWVQGRPLPDGRLDNVHIQQVREAYETYLQTCGLGEAEIARQVGYSQSVLSQFRAASYKGHNADVARALNAWMERDARRRRASLESDYVPTSVAEDMRAIAHVAVETTSMAAIIAPSGSGKTMVLELLARELNGFYIYCDEDATPRRFFHQLGQAIGVKTTNYSTGEIKGHIITRLRGTNRPILLDEAHRLPPAVLGRIRSLHDQANVCIVMTGTHEILDRIDDRGGGRGQMSGRVLRYNAMEHVAGGEAPDGQPNRAGRPLFTKSEIQQFFQSMGVRLDRDAFELLWATLPRQAGLIRLLVLFDRGLISTPPLLRSSVKRLFFRGDPLIDLTPTLVVAAPLDPLRPRPGVRLTPALPDRGFAIIKVQLGKVVPCSFAAARLLIAAAPVDELIQVAGRAIGGIPAEKAGLGDVQPGVFLF